MIKKSLFLFFLIFLTNCTHPGSALLGPAFTGITTGSVGQASMSYGTNQIVKKIKDASIKTKQEVKKVAQKIEEFDIETRSKDFYASVKNLYLQDQNKKKKVPLFHR